MATLGFSLLLAAFGVVPALAANIVLGVLAVFMGANTYIGNAPNFMVKSIAEERGVVMPSFFGYMAWAAVKRAAAFRANEVVNERMKELDEDDQRALYERLREKFGGK